MRVHKMLEDDIMPAWPTPLGLWMTRVPDLRPVVACMSRARELQATGLQLQYSAIFSDPNARSSK